MWFKNYIQGMRLFKENKLFKWYLERKGFLTQEECDNIISEYITSNATFSIRRPLLSMPRVNAVNFQTLDFA